MAAKRGSMGSKEQFTQIRKFVFRNPAPGHSHAPAAPAASTMPQQKLTDDRKAKDRSWMSKASKPREPAKTQVAGMINLKTIAGWTPKW
jgi:hypothetical protein